MLTMFYEHIDLGNMLLLLCPQLMELHVYGNINIKTLTYFLCCSLNSTVHIFAAMFKLPRLLCLVLVLQSSLHYGSGLTYTIPYCIYMQTQFQGQTS